MADITCRIMLYHDRLDCEAPAGVFVDVSRYDAAGQLRARGEGRSDARAGTVHLRLRALGDTSDAWLRPGDRLEFMTAGTAPTSLMLPPFSVDITIDPNGLEGRSTPSSEVEVYWGEPNGSQQPLGRAITDSDGRWDLPLPMGPVPNPGETGFARMFDQDGNQFDIAFGKATVEIALDERELRGVASAGTLVTAEIASATSGQQEVALAHFDGGDSAPAWSLPAPRLSSGTVISITMEGPTGRRPMDAVVTIPELRARAAVGDREVTGIGPADSMVVLQLGPLREILRGGGFARMLETDAEGSFSVALPDGLQVEPGWTVRLIHQPIRGVWIRSHLVLPTLRAVVFGSEVSGTVNPRQPITVTLEDPAGRPRAMGTTPSTDSGTFFLRFVGYGIGTAEHILPGDRILIDVGQLGDPKQLVIPDMSAIADAEGDRLRGQGPPLWRVDASIEIPQQAPIGSTEVDDRGRFELPVALHPGMAGTLTFAEGGGDVLELHWAALRMAWDLTQPLPRLSGTAPTGRTVHAELQDRSGATVGRCEHPFPSSSGSPVASWKCGFVDITGLAVLPSPGDRVQLQVGTETRELGVPDLQLAIDVDADRVDGRIDRPHQSVQLGAEREQGPGQPSERSPVVEVTSDADGRFVADFAERFPLRFNDRIFGDYTTDDAIDVRFSRIAGGLVVDLDSGRIRGAGPPNSQLRVILRSASDIRAEMLTTSARDGSFDVLLERDGRWLAPQTGDELIVSASGGPIGRLTIPRLELEIDPGSGQIEGWAPSQGRLVLGAGAAGFRRRDMTGFAGSAQATVDPSGRYRVDAADFEYPPGVPAPLSLTPGLRLEARVALPSGHVLERGSTIPMINLMHGTNTVCGYGNPGDPVDLIATSDAGVELARARGQVDREGRFELVLGGAQGPLETRSGQTIRGEVGRTDIDLPIPRIEATARWHEPSGPGRGLAAAEIEGIGPSRSDYYVSQRSTAGASCFAGDEPPAFSTYGTTTLQGRFDTRLDAIRPGHGVEVAFFDRSGHRWSRYLGRLRLRVHLHSDRVEGIGQALDPVDLALTDSEGRLRATRSVRVDARGILEAGWADDASTTVHALPGDRVIAQATNDRAELLLEPFNFDFSSEIGIIGQAPPDRPLVVELDLLDGRDLTIDLQSGPDGRFGLAPADLPPIRDWTFEDLRTLTVLLPTVDGHELAIETILRSEPPRHTLFMPFLLERR